MKVLRKLHKPHSRWPICGRDCSIRSIYIAGCKQFTVSKNNSRDFMYLTLLTSCDIVVGKERRISSRHQGL